MSSGLSTGDSDCLPRMYYKEQGNSNTIHRAVPLGLEFMGPKNGNLQKPVFYGFQRYMNATPGSGDKEPLKIEKRPLLSASDSVLKGAEE